MTLAPYAMSAVLSQGRDHPHLPDGLRDEFARDRDRIVHCRAFRRLQHKTQVFTTDTGDHFRNRLTHTIEVAQLARSAARRLQLNEDLVECVALVHDVGHPPFGHQGETMLAELMADHGGFEHNRQGLRIVEQLEIRYPEFAGLNLTFEVRESIIKHAAHYDRTRIPARFAPDQAPLLEAQLVDEMDSIAYDCHDVDDGLRAGLITLDGLREVPLFAGAWDEACASSPRTTPNRLLIDRALRRMLDSLVGGLVDHSQHQLRDHRIATLAAVRASTQPLITLGISQREAKETLEAWLFTHLYRHHLVNRTFHRAKRMLRELYQFYANHPDALAPDYAARIEADGLERVVADYIAGMTDRFAEDEYRRLFG